MQQHNSIFAAVIWCACVGAALISSSAFADSAAAVVATVDKDSDHTLDIPEVEASAGAKFVKLDADSDGTLDNAELKGVVGKKTFLTIDKDHDGTVSKQEYLDEVDVPKSAHTLKHLID